MKDSSLRAAQEMLARLLSHKSFGNPNPKNYHLFNEFMESEADETVIYGANRIGKSETGAFKCVTYLVGFDPTHPDRKIPKNAKIWVITDAANVTVILEKIYRWLPDWTITKRNHTRGEWEINTIFGAKLWIKTHDQERRKFQGQNLDLVWWDEEPTSEDIYTEVLMRLTDNDGKQIWTYTPRIGSVWLHRHFNGLREEDRGAKTGKISWTSAGLMQNPYIPPANRNKAYERAKEQYRGQPELFKICILGEYIVFEGEPVFPKSCIDHTFSEKESVSGFILDTRQNDLTQRFQFTESEVGPLTVWERPIYGVEYSIGGDACNDKRDGDASCLVVFRRDNHDVVAIWHLRCDAYDLGIRMYELGYYYNIAWLNPEANPPGNSTVTALRHKSYPRLCRRRDASGALIELKPAFGALVSAWTKPLWVQTVSKMVKELMISFHCPHLAEEMDLFRKIDKRNKDAESSHHGYGAVSGHDDRVMALIHAVMAHLNSPLSGINTGRKYEDVQSPERQRVIDILSSVEFKGKKYNLNQGAM